MSFTVGINEEEGVLGGRKIRKDCCIYVCENHCKILAKLLSWARPPSPFYITADFHSPHSFPCCEQLHLSIISIKNIFGRKAKPSICEAARHFSKPFQLQAVGVCTTSFDTGGKAGCGPPLGRGVWASSVGFRERGRREKDYLCFTEGEKFQVIEDKTPVINIW